MHDVEIPAASAQMISYATPQPRSGPRLAAAVWIAIIGLVLIVLGGCFLIGVMVVFSPSVLFSGPSSSGALTASVKFYLVVLYVMAFTCFGGAIAILVRALRLLFGFAVRA